MFGYFEDQFNKLCSTLAPETSSDEKFYSGITNGDYELVKSQIECRAFDVNHRNPYGNCPLHIAAQRGQISIVKYLLEKGANHMAVGIHGNTCLHFAALSGNLELVKIFIQLGLNPVQKNLNGKTAYDLAAGFGVKQYLMPLIFSEERRNGTAPPPMIGATLDPTEEAKRLANIAPPPRMDMANKAQVNNLPPGISPPQILANSAFSTSGLPQPASLQYNSYIPNGNSSNSEIPSSFSGDLYYSAQHSQASNGQITTGTARNLDRKVIPPPISTQSNYFNGRPTSKMMYEPDGFGTSVGNPKLAAKYGNKDTYDDGRGSSLRSPSPVIYEHSVKPSPFARGRYVPYNTSTGSEMPPVPNQYAQMDIANASSLPNYSVSTDSSANNIRVWCPNGVSSQPQPQVASIPAGINEYSQPSNQIKNSADAVPISLKFPTS